MSNSSDPLTKDSEEIHSQQATPDSRPQSTPELKRPCITDPLSEKNVAWPPVEDCRVETSSEKSNTEHNDKGTKDSQSEDASGRTFSPPLPSQQTLSANPKEPSEACREPMQREDADLRLGAEQKEKVGPTEGAPASQKAKRRS
ncbi:hypothetical protein AAFF_G00292860 [Aldrovandia affinis]|uniref:Uncharacterized protein n=1 Tax=Aldrovandia affinis TaxID=143900 RepID=A0AAD7WS43_9TELE|nr:hypothetical protein AAFF_G00292860 [Aldrovandia affinis]